MRSKKENIDWDDIVFENRNKEYGAYPIRKGYKKRFVWSLVIAILLVFCVVLFLSHAQKEYLPPPPALVKTTDVHIKEFQMPKFPMMHRQLPPKPKPRPKETIRSKAERADALPVVTSNTRKVDQNLLINPITSANKAVENVDGPELDLKPFVQPELKEKTELPTAHVEDITDKKASTKVQSLPHYPSGDSAWYQYLRKNLNVNMVLRNGAMPSVYTAVVAFIVKPDSTLSDCRIIKDPGYGAGAEALRVIQKSGKWIPGTKNGKPVNFVQLQTVIFKVNN